MSKDFVKSCLSNERDRVKQEEVKKKLEREMELKARLGGDVDENNIKKEDPALVK